MRVRELVEALAAMPPDAVVVIPGYEGGSDEVGAVVRDTARHCRQQWYYGAWWRPHDEDLLDVVLSGQGEPAPDTAPVVCVALERKGEEER